MKQRVGFVSNSSSASFVIPDITRLSKEQYNAIFDHINYALSHHIPCGKVNGFGYCHADVWSLSLCENAIHGETLMDNFFFDVFLKHIGVPLEAYNYDSEEGFL
jgi:hypothetical protein